ncbi:MAG TPA: hypothetical protein VLA96_13960 [Terriglobales bacterium]|nr:hypothetical protein [Terriglobales bacterium]
MKRILALFSLFLAFTLTQAQTAPAPQVTGPTVAKTPESATEPDSDTAQKEKEKEKPGAAADKKKSAAKDEQGRAGDKKEEKKDEKKKDPFASGTFSGMKLRNIGPSFPSGRVEDVAVNPNNKAEIYIAVASGGVWKTTDAGYSWTPVFDGEGSYSIGVVQLDPKNPCVVWVGTGEDNSQRSVGYGDGVYKSVDCGKSWTNVGLKHSEHIGEILIDPRDSNTIYVAAQGPLWGPGGDRGVYLSRDGGKTWKKSLYISENTGANDLAQDPEDPDTIYATTYQRRRHVFTLIDGGPESAIYKTTDGGKTWNTINSGLPSVDLGRIGIAVSPADRNVVYAVVEAADGKSGVFRSTDRGANWEKRADFSNGAMYYGHIFADPKNVDRIYLSDTFTRISEDGGKTIRRLGDKQKHVDSHVVWIDPDDTKHLIVGCDGGLYVSYDRGASWGFIQNLPVVQFYDVAVDNSSPFYYVCGGTQDNNSMCGPARTRSASGIINADWFITNGGDGFRSAIDPEDPNTIYAESQYGGLVRFDRKTGEILGIQPQEARNADPHRWNWDSPFIISPHSHTRLYFAAQKLYRSDDRGNTWRAISGDLTRQIDRNKLPVMGKVWGIDAVAKNQSTDFYGNSSALAESPVKEGLIYLGSDDGLIQITEDGGQNWRKVETFPGVPALTYVSRIAASNHDAHTVYAAFENHKNNDFKPYLLKSTDAGKTWTSIAGNLPENHPVLAIAEDPVNPKLLFAGTEFGLFFTSDGGAKWVQLKGGLPTVAIRDAVIQKKANDLVLASFGRGFWVLDDITPLRQVTPAMLDQNAALFPARDALMYIQSLPFGGFGAASQGTNFYFAKNPPYGATFTYYLKEKLKTKKELRQEREKEAEKNKQQAPFPTNDELRAESEAEAPQVFLVVFDDSNTPIRRIPASNSAGLSRVTWDLRYPPAELPEGGGGFYDDPELAAFFGPQGPLVMPGKYTAALYQKQDGQFTQLAGPQPVNVTVEGVSEMKPEDRKALSDFQHKVVRLNRAVSGAVNLANEVRDRLKKIKEALNETPGKYQELVKRADQLEKRNTDLLRELRGDVALRRRDIPTLPSINDRANLIMDDERMSTSPPTETHKANFALAAEDFSKALASLKQLVEGDLATLERDMEAAGAPWTPGRVPSWSPDSK